MTSAASAADETVDAEMVELTLAVVSLAEADCDSVLVVGDAVVEAFSVSSLTEVDSDCVTVVLASVVVCSIVVDFSSDVVESALVSS